VTYVTENLGQEQRIVSRRKTLYYKRYAYTKLVRRLGILTNNASIKI